MRTGFKESFAFSVENVMELRGPACVFKPIMAKTKKNIDEPPKMDNEREASAK